MPFFLQLFATTASNYPNHPAIAWQTGTDEATLSYCELDEKSTMLAHYLQKQGIEFAKKISQTGLFEPIVAIRCARDNPQWILWVIACFKAGAAVVLLDKSLTVEECINRLDNLDSNKKIGCKIIIDDEITLEEYARTKMRKHINVSDPAFSPMVDADSLSSIETVLPGKNYLAYIAFTSSTSSPIAKAIAIDHDAIEPIVNAYKETMGVNLGERILQASSFHFDVCFAELFCLAMQDRAITLVLPSEPEQLFYTLPQAINKQNINLLTAVPDVLERHRHDLRSPLRHVVSTGEAGREELFQQLQSQGVKISGGYGPAEHGVGSTMSDDPMMLGEPMAGKKVFLCAYPIPDGESEVKNDDKLRGKIISFDQLKERDEGEILIAGKGLARGYVKNGVIGGETCKKFITFTEPQSGEEMRGYFTGDLARYEQGLRFIDRIDNQFKISGVRLQPGSLGKVIKTIIDELAQGEDLEIERVEIVPKKFSCNDGAVIKRTVGFIITNNEGFGLDTMSIRRTILESGSIPAIAIPRFLFLLPHKVIKERGLRTPSGKLRYKKLKALANDESFLERLVKLPVQNDVGEGAETTTEKYIVDICRRALGFHEDEYPITLSTDLKDCGASSLELTAIKQALEKAYDIDLNIPPYLNGNLTVKQIIADVICRRLFQEGFTIVKQGDEKKKSIFCMPPASGDCGQFSNLKVSTQQQIIGLSTPYVMKARGLDEGSVLPEFIKLYCEKYSCQTMEAIATYAVYGMQRIQPQGPYNVAGFSLGGDIAMAVAAQLGEINEKVQWLGLLDPPLPGTLRTALTNNKGGVEKIKIVIFNIAGYFPNLTFDFSNLDISNHDEPKGKIKKIFALVQEQLRVLQVREEDVTKKAKLAKAANIYASLESNLLALEQYEWHEPIVNATYACLYYTDEHGMLPLENIAIWADYVLDVNSYRVAGTHMELLKSDQLLSFINADLEKFETINRRQTDVTSPLLSSAGSEGIPAIGQSPHNFFRDRRRILDPSAHVQRVHVRQDLVVTSVDASPSVSISEASVGGNVIVSAVTTNMSEAQGVAVSNVLRAIYRR